MSLRTALLVALAPYASALSNLLIADCFGRRTHLPSAACTFTDVTSADLLTRGQIVTIFNNIDVMGGGVAGSFLDNGGTFNTVLNFHWNNWGLSYHLRPAAFSDVSIGQFYANPVQYAYAVGVADGTSATTFSPNQPVLRGEFAKMLYRALSLM